jgi:uncharacterized protein (UPF0179 family)
VYCQYITGYGLLASRQTAQACYFTGNDVAAVEVRRTSIGTVVRLPVAYEGSLKSTGDCRHIFVA